MRSQKIFVAFLVAMTITLTSLNTTQAQSAYRPQPTNSVKKIEWGTNLYAAYKESLASRKPLVVFFYVYSGNYSTQFARDVLYTTQMNAFANRAVFARVDVETDDGYKNVTKMIGSLGLTEYPAVVVLDCWPDKIVERGRLVGFQKPQMFYAFFNNLLLKKPSAQISRR
jgi:hypothetical protein